MMMAIMGSINQCSMYVSTGMDPYGDPRQVHMSIFGLPSTTFFFFI